jgi:hypothetical protein
MIFFSQCSDFLTRMSAHSRVALPRKVAGCDCFFAAIIRG